MAEGTIASAIRAAAERLADESGTARLDAEVLMAHALGTSRSALLLTHMRDAPPPAFEALVERRSKGEPVAYITGTQEFYGLEFAVSPDVLIPRGDSETLVDAALTLRPDATRVLDCGTGSGALLLGVLHNLETASGIGIDASPGALAIAARNADSLGLSGRARFALANWHEAGWTDDLGAPFDLVLANPPYVESGAVLDRDVADYEPASALFSGDEGLDDYRVLVPQLPGLLAKNGIALVEIGYRQAEAVSAIGEAAGLCAELRNDLAGRPRVLVFSAGN